MIANMGNKEGKNINMDTLVRICETLDCGIKDKSVNKNFLLYKASSIGYTENRKKYNDSRNKKGG